MSRSRKHTRIRILIDPGAFDIITAELIELGITSFQLQDKDTELGGRLFIAEDRLLLTFYLLGNKQAEPDKIINQLDNAARRCGSALERVEIDQIKAEDYLAAWQRTLTPMPVGKTLIIIPGKKLPPDPLSRIPIIIYPATAFGTGFHETTRCCLELLEEFISPADWVLDIGCGSGILGIAALKLGASKVKMIDIDSEAIENTYMNLELNGILLNPVLECCDVRDLEETGFFDIVCANLYVQILIDCAEKIIDCLKENGVLICSGIVKEKASQICRALINHGMEIIEEVKLEDYFGLVARKIDN